MKNHPADSLGAMKDALQHLDDIYIPMTDNGDVRVEQLQSRGQPCAYCGRTDPGNSHSCVGCGAPVERGPKIINVKSEDEYFWVKDGPMRIRVPKPPPLRVVRG